MELNIPHYLFNFNLGASAILLISVLSLIWFGVSRMTIELSERMKTGAILSVALLGWFALALYLGQRNTYWAINNLSIPTVQFAILLPIIIGLWLLVRSRRVALFVDALPLPLLVGVQFYRVLGFMFLVLWWGGHLPWQFALPAGIGDIATGVLALIVAYMLAKGLASGHRAAYAWCMFGITDLVIAVTFGALTSPGRTHFVSLDDPNLLVTAYPLVMIPTFAVPLSIILHVLCLWKLRRLREQGYPSKHEQNSIEAEK
jgi:hypothetical protein